MRFSSEFLEELRGRISPSAVIGRKVALKTKGRGEYGGLCPFHKEKTPSFTVSDDKGFYHCFGCGAHGDIIRFTMETSGMSFSDSVEKLAGEVGLPLPRFSHEMDEKFKKISNLYGVMEATCDFLQKQLHSSHGRAAKEYLEKRGMGSDVMEKFRLGFAPDNFISLKTHLAAQGVSEEMMIEAGVAVKNDLGEVYGRFRNRVIFPITDAKGRVIAFGGRIIGEGQPKYLNSSETELFKKGKNLYNWNLAKATAREKGEVVVVEGYVDVIALSKAGIENAVAPLGTALTVDQLAMLWQVVKEPTMCLDGDEAGKRAMARIAEIYLPLLKPGYSMKFATLPKGEDPDDVVKNKGALFMKKILEAATPLSEIIWQVETEGKNIKTPEQKAALEKRLQTLADSISDKAVRTYYHNFFRDKIWNSVRGKKLSKINEKAVSTGVKNLSVEEISKIVGYEYHLLGIVISYPQLLRDSEFEEGLANIDFSSKNLDMLRCSILEITAQTPDIGKKELLEHFEKVALKEQADKALARLPKSEISIEIAKSGWQFCFANINYINMKNICDLEEETAMNSGDDEKLKELKDQLSLLKNLAEKEENSYELILEGN